MNNLAATAAPVNPTADDFHHKAALLAERFELVDPEQFQREIFGDAMTALSPYIATDAAAATLRRFCNREAAFKDALQNGALYMAYADYFPRCPPENKFLHKLYAFVVDIDGVFPENAAWLVSQVFDVQKASKCYLQPTHVVNSGRGIHLIYALDHPLDAYWRRLPVMQHIHRGLQRIFALQGGNPYLPSFGKVDFNASLAQPYKMPGCPTKVGLPSQVYRTGAICTVGTLEEYFRVAVPPPPDAPKDPALTDQLATLPPESLALVQKKPWHDEKPARRPATRPAEKNAPAANYTRMQGEAPAALKKWLSTTFERAKREVPEGSRATALYALAVLASWQKTPAEQVNELLAGVVAAWRARGDSEPFKPSELTKVQRQYGKLTKVRMHSSTINLYLGFDACRVREGQQRHELTIAERIKAEIDRRVQAGEEVTTTTIANAVGVPRDRVSRVVSIKAKGRRIEWKNPKENNALQK